MSTATTAGSSGTERLTKTAVIDPSMTPNPPGADAARSPAGHDPAQHPMGGVGQEKQRPAPQAAVVDEHDPVDEQRDEEGHAGAGHAECHRLEVMAQHERREADRDEEEQRE